MTYFNLIDTETSNVIGRYDSEQDALRLVEELLETHGEEFVRELQLGGRDEAGRVLPVVDGDELVRRARHGFVAATAKSAG
jgi:hypothetical protein